MNFIKSNNDEVIRWIEKWAIKLAENVLSAWNTQDVEKVISCYTEDCIYQDPNTLGACVRT